LQPAYRRFVVDDQDRGGIRIHDMASDLPVSGTGKVMVKTAPCPPLRLPASIVPPMASMKPRQMARPVPARWLSALRTR
jgi:hypothetical protein